MQRIDLLQTGDPRLDVRVLLWTRFHNNFHCQAVEDVFKDALQSLRLLFDGDVQAAKDPEIFSAAVLIAVLVCWFLLVVPALVLEVSALLAEPVGPRLRNLGLQKQRPLTPASSKALRKFQVLPPNNTET